MSNHRTLVFPAGSAIIFTEGEYSDYGHCGAVVTLKEADLPKLVQEFKDSYRPEREYDRPRPSGFVAWLITSGYAFPAEIEEVHLGSYGDLDASDPDDWPR